MRFEAKHSFVKRVIRDTNCYKNILYSLAQRHQFQTEYYLHMCRCSNASLEVADVPTLLLEVLSKDIALAVKKGNSNMDNINLAKNVTYFGFNYRIGMVVAHGSLAGLPELFEIVHMIVLQEKLILILKKLNAWYLEHCWAYHLVISTTAELILVGAHELTNPYPLAHYMVGGRHLISEEIPTCIVFYIYCVGLELWESFPNFPSFINVDSESIHLSYRISPLP